jgi:hypothetical protein
MSWIHYLLIYCGLCYTGIICLYVYNKWKRPDCFGDDIKIIIIIILIAPLIPFILPVGLIAESVINRKKIIMRENRRKEEEKRENEIKSKLGLRADENYLCFSRMGGFGVIRCCDCGYQEKITCFTHGSYSCSIGRQCPHCHAFIVENNSSKKYHTFGDRKEDFVCPRCGVVVSKKDESFLKGNDDPLFCPKCHSARLHYHMIYIT